MNVQKTLRELVDKNYQDRWHETIFGYEFTWVSAKNYYRVDRHGRVHPRNNYNKMVDEKLEATTALANFLGYQYTPAKIFPNTARTREAYFQEVRTASACVHTDIDCVEVSTPPSDDWQLHIELFTICDKFLRSKGFTHKRMRGIEQTQDMHVNVSFGNELPGVSEAMRRRLNILYAQFPALSWIFAASYNNETAQIPDCLNTWDTLRSKRKSYENSYIEFRAPEMVSSPLEVRAVGEFHRKLYTFAHSLNARNVEYFDAFAFRKHLNKRLRTITFEDCIRDFYFWCDLLDVDFRLFERMAHHNLWRRLKYYPECRI